jgi:phosphoribosyl 1,2-cyclic phosphate phosphodiesterase
MDITFLGTGSAWALPEHSCSCAICATMARLGEERTRTSFLIGASENILVDCGPDVRLQMRRVGMERPDLVLITHEHGDHYLGLDDLLAFRRAVPKEAWRPIPVYATEKAWAAIEVRFGYLLGSLIEKRFAVPGMPLDGCLDRITPFKTFHGPTAAGSVGYVVEQIQADGSPFKLVYTSDLVRVEEEVPGLAGPDVLVIQSHWLNEPEENRPHHLSFQRAMEFIRRWNPKRATYLVHISDADEVPGDPANNMLKKYIPLSPLLEPFTSVPYPVPRCHEEWQSVVNRIARDYELPGPLVVAFDGLVITFPES